MVYQSICTLAARWRYSRQFFRAACLVLVVAILLAAFPSALLAAPATSDQPSAAYSGSYYIVRAGDTLSNIAQRFGTTTTAIANANGISNTNYIYVGQRLYIPASSAGGTTSWPVDSSYYIVKAGDSLSILARRFNTTVQAIAQTNGISNTSYIYVGQRLVMPTGYAYPPSVYGFYYTVRAGDTLGQIAKWYGVSIYTLASVNGISNMSRIYVGQRLYIP